MSVLIRSRGDFYNKKRKAHVAVITTIAGTAALFMSRSVRNFVTSPDYRKPGLFEQAKNLNR